MTCIAWRLLLLKGRLEWRVFFFRSSQQNQFPRDPMRDGMPEESAPLVGQTGAGARASGRWKLATGGSFLVALAAIGVALFFALRPHAALRSPDKRACSNRGISYPESGGCECFQCFDGDHCEKAVPNCTIVMTTADGKMFEEFFEQPSIANAEEYSTTIPPFYRYERA